MPIPLQMPYPSVAIMPQKPDRSDNSPERRREIKDVRKGLLVTKTTDENLNVITSRDKKSENDAVAIAIEKEAKKIPFLYEVPLVPITDSSQIEGKVYYNVGDFYEVKPRDYLVLAKGAPLLGQGVTEGDLIFVRPQERCDSGDIALVLLQGPMGPFAAQMRVEYSHDSPVIHFHPLNDSMKAIDVNVEEEKPGRPQIVGVRRGVIKQH